MAIGWIKIGTATADKPEVHRIARLMAITPNAALGALVRMWSWFDDNSVDGVVDGVVDADVDAVVSADGFCAAARAVGWLADHVGSDGKSIGVMLPNFGRHNGETAKQRALKANRQAAWRRSKVDGRVDGSASTTPSTREEKRREEKIEDNTPPTPQGGDEASASMVNALKAKLGRDPTSSELRQLAGFRAQLAGDPIVVGGKPVPADEAILACIAAVKEKPRQWQAYLRQVVVNSRGDGVLPAPSEPAGTTAEPAPARAMTTEQLAKYGYKPRRAAP